MKEQIYYELAKLGLIISWLGAAALGCVLGYSMVFHKLFNTPCTVLLFVALGLLMLFAYPMTKLRNKYRDAIEYDSNGISTAQHFSNLSNNERREVEKHKMLQRELLIDSITLKNITKKGSAEPEKDLQQMIGMADIKDELDKMKARLVFRKEMKKYDKYGQFDTSNHMVLYGGVGTGKSTSVRIITGFLYKYGYIRKNKYIEVDGNFFNGSSFGESTKRITYILGQATGGILFIDEAYAMLNSMESQEVIATLVKVMEDKRNDLVVILAGYKREMEQLINSNSGLQSRIKYYMVFKDYSPDELWDIFKLMASKKGFTVDEDLYDNFTSRILEQMQKPNYGNARTVRNLLDMAIDTHGVNYVNNIISRKDKMTLVAADMPVTSDMLSVTTEHM